MRRRLHASNRNLLASAVTRASAIRDAEPLSAALRESHRRHIAFWICRLIQGKGSGVPAFLLAETSVGPRALGEVDS